MEMFHHFINLELLDQLMIVLHVIILSVLQGFSLSRREFAWKFLFLSLTELFLYGFLEYFRVYNMQVHIFYLICSIPFSLIFWAIFSTTQANTKRAVVKLKSGEIWKLYMPIKKGGKLIYENIKRGIAILGSAGSGKTVSCFVPIINHCAFHNFAGITLDYKDGELTELINYFYAKHHDVPHYKEGIPRVQVKNLCLHRPEISDFVNVLDPVYLKTQDDLYLALNTLFAYNKGNQSKYDFFENAPQSCLGGVIWRLRENYPNYCSLPYAIAICLQKHPLAIAEFISKSISASVIGSASLKSFSVDQKGNMSVGEQMTGIMGTLADILRQYASPNMFYVMQKNDFPLDLNNPEHPVMLNVINSPKYDSVYSPFYSMCIAVIINQMSERGRSHAALVFDEGATTKIPKFYKIPSTRRSYDITTFYGIQDKVISDLTYSDTETRAILANLSYLLIGKSNDAESVKYYKSILEEVKEKTKTTSKSPSLLGGSGTRVSEGERETSKFKNQDISGLKQGEFVSYADGKSESIKFRLMEFDKIPPKSKRSVSQFDIQNHYEKVLRSVDQFE